MLSLGFDGRRARLGAVAAMFMAGCGQTPDADVVLRGGTIVDGTGKPRFVADVGIGRDGKIAAIGPGLGRGAREIDATGCWVTPGLIDAHSHTAIVGGVNDGTGTRTGREPFPPVSGASLPAVHAVAPPRKHPSGTAGLYFLSESPSCSSLSLSDATLSSSSCFFTASSFGFNGGPVLFFLGFFPIPICARGRRSDRSFPRRRQGKNETRRFQSWGNHRT